MKKFFLFLLSTGLILSSCGNNSNNNSSENGEEQTEINNDQSLLKDVTADKISFIGFAEGEEKPELPQEMLKYVGEKLNYCQITKSKFSTKWNYVMVIYGLDANEDDFNALIDYYKSIGGELTQKTNKVYDAVFPFGETDRCELFGSHAVTQLNFGKK